MADAFCSDCKRNTEVVFDHSAGDTVCSECGLPNGASGEFLSSSLGRWQNRGSNPDRGLILAFKTIATMSDRRRLWDFEIPSLSLTICGLSLFLEMYRCILDRANEIYKKVEDQKSSRGRNQDALLAACLYIACRQEDKPRTVKEICSVANGATKKEIGRAKEYIVKQLGLETGQSVEMGAIHAGDFMRRFCSNLGMNNQAVKAAQEAVQKSEEFDIRRSPISIAAAVIYIITQLSDDKKPLKDISVATGVAEGTIRNSYKDLYPHVSKIIPNWYAKEEDLKNLCSP
ncbi:hypothetical protein Goklo_026590 [Gossypium klotzschianum]|uniref:TFIIB-type domain-containing protein n=1 Tax=Gossypium klotzschianum TaxID=34286 RepID=A0A7J8TV95_9ROSI|nr:hypothetical protein [Gossypium klotzschianum]